MRRSLSGIFFISHDPDTGERGPICFEELSQAERDRVTVGQPVEWLKSLADQLAKTLKEVGDKFDIVKEDTE